MKRWLNILIIVCVLLTASSLKAEDEPTLPKTPEGKTDWNKIRYKDFLEIKVFDKLLTRVFFMDDDAEKIGLDANELTNYLKLRIKNNFDNIKIEKADFDKYTSKQMGYIHLRVWVVADSYSIPYHLDCKFWNNDYTQSAPIWDTEQTRGQVC